MNPKYLKDWRKDFSMYNFDPVIHTNDGKIWLDSKQVKDFISYLLTPPPSRRSKKGKK